MKSLKKPKWAVFQSYRETGLLEDICQHSIGHPNEAWLKENDPDNKRCLATHGCDGCCFKEVKWKIQR